MSYGLNIRGMKAGNKKQLTVPFIIFIADDAMDVS